MRWYGWVGLVAFIVGPAVWAGAVLLGWVPSSGVMVVAMFGSIIYGWGCAMAMILGRMEHRHRRDVARLWGRV